MPARFLAAPLAPLLLLLVAGCAASPSLAQPPAAPQPQAAELALDLARHGPDSRHFEGRARRSELIAGGRAAEVAREESLSVMGGEDGFWKDPRVAPSSVLAFTLGITPRNGALDLSMDPGPGRAMSFSVDNRLGRDIRLAPVMLRRSGAGEVQAAPGRPCRLGDGAILAERLPPDVIAVVVPAGAAPLAEDPRCGRDHAMFPG